MVNEHPRTEIQPNPKEDQARFEIPPNPFWNEASAAEGEAREARSAVAEAIAAGADPTEAARLKQELNAAEGELQQMETEAALDELLESSLDQVLDDKLNLFLDAANEQSPQDPEIAGKWASDLIWLEVTSEPPSLLHDIADKLLGKDKPKKSRTSFRWGEDNDPVDLSRPIFLDAVRFRLGTELKKKLTERLAGRPEFSGTKAMSNFETRGEAPMISLLGGNKGELFRDMLAKNPKLRALVGESGLEAARKITAALDKVRSTAGDRGLRVVNGHGLVSRGLDSFLRSAESVSAVGSLPGAENVLEEFIPSLTKGNINPEELSHSMPLEMAVAMAENPQLLDQVVQNPDAFPPATRRASILGAVSRFGFQSDKDHGQEILRMAEYRAKALRIAESLPEDERQEVLASLAENAADSDFGDIQDLERIATMAIGPETKKRVQDAAASVNRDRAQKVESSNHAFEAHSKENTTRMMAIMERNANSAYIENQIGRIRESMFYTINLPFEALSGILSAGKIRSCWETKNKDYTECRQKRHLTELELGTRGTGTERDPHTVYGAVGYENGIDEKKGVAPQYGDCFIRLKPKSVRRSATYTFGDSFHGPIAGRRFVHDDVAVARAAIDIAGMDEKYVEFQMKGVGLEDIESINIPKQLAQERGAELGRLSAQHPGLRIHIIE